MQASIENRPQEQSANRNSYQDSTQTRTDNSASPRLIRNAMMVNLVLLGLIMSSYCYGGLFIKEIVAASVIIMIVAALKLNESKIIN